MSAPANLVQIVNSGDSVYRGTVISGLPTFPNTIGGGELDIIARNPVTGQIYEAAYENLISYDEGEHLNGQKWILVGVSGEFSPGTTELLIEPNFSGTRNPWFIPVNWDLAKRGTWEVVLVDPVTGVSSSHSLKLSSLVIGSDNSIVHYSNETFMMIEFFGDFTPYVAWRVFATARKGEEGVRYQLQLENRLPGFGQPGHQPGIVASSRFIYESKPGQAVSDQVIDLPRGFNNRASTAIGDVHLAWGAETGPVRLEKEGDLTTVTVVSSLSYIPQGGSWAPAARPGDPPGMSNEVDPRSSTGLFFREKIEFEIFLGSPMDKNHVDCPPQMLLSNKSLYDSFLPSGLTPAVPFKDADGNHVLENTERYERLISAYIDPEACDKFYGQLVTYRVFADRGGTYEKPPLDNGFFGIRDFGDDMWSDGYGGANHYQAGDSCLTNWLRSGDFRWFYEGFIRARHFRTWDFQWHYPSSDPEVTHKYEGMATYEKGWHHGNASAPLLTHTWCQVAALGYVLTGHPELLRLCQQNARSMMKYNTFWGGNVLVQPGRDPRDWGAPTSRHSYGTITGGHPAGWYGDYGQRAIGRAFENAAFYTELLGAELGYDMRSYMLNCAKQVERVESQIWGGHGYILNRASRGNRHSDGEQGWMHNYLVRGLGWVLKYCGEAGQAYRPLYERMLNFLWTKLIIYGDTNAQGTRPPRIVGYYNAFGEMNITRHGLTGYSLDKWYAWRKLVQMGQNDPAVFDAWYVAFQAEKTRLEMLVEQNGDQNWTSTDPGFLSYAAAIERIKTAGGVVSGPADADFKHCLSDQWTYLEQSSYANVNHGMVTADVLAQAALELGHPVEKAVMAVRLAENNLWHLQDNASAPRYQDIRDNPSQVSYRMGMYPSSETKIYPNQLDSHYLRKLLELWDVYVGTAVWGPDSDMIIEEYLASPATASASSEAPSESVAANLDANGHYSPLIADPDENSDILVENDPRIK